ncbi:MAG: hypothetical protein ACRETQ_10380 [Gammaproteobacteria bacterium]
MLGLSIQASADQFGPLPQPTTHFTLDVGVTGGGDKLAVVSFNDGSSESLYAGDSGYIDAGVIQDFGDPHWSIMGTLGYAYISVNASNATVSFSHLPLEVGGLYNFGNSHVGFGVRYDVDPRLDLGGFGANQNFNNSLGWFAEYRWWLFGLRYTNITYRSSQGNVNGNNWGVFLNFTF